jgi:protein SCO1/2
MTEKKEVIRFFPWLLDTPSLSLVVGAVSFLSLLVPKANSATELPAAPAAIIEKVSFDQNLGAQVPLDAPFRDEQGHAITLGAVLKRRTHPAVLVMGYHECPMLCSLVLSGLVESFNDLRMTAGEQFEVIDVSIKPGEDTALAAAQKRVYLKRYGRGAGAGVGWHFLTGDEEAIHRLTDTVGFHYAYDPATRQFAHASGIVILTPDGRVARYFFGVNYDPRELQAALTSAGAREISSPIEKLLLLCFHYNPINGKYGILIMRAMRVGGALTLVAVFGFLGVLIRRERRLPATLPSETSA